MAFGDELFAVPSAALTEIGKEPSEHVKAPESWGLGSDAYVVQFEAFQQIHCCTYNSEYAQILLQKRSARTGASLHHFLRLGNTADPDTLTQ